MVQQYESPIRVYKYPFELVMAAYEKRFPTCPMIPVFVGSETMNEYKSPDGAVHIVERRCKLNLEAPYILKKIVGVEYVYFIQKNSLDRRAKTLKIQAHNESFSSRIIIREDCLYSVHPENPNWTCFEQSASLDVLSFFGFEATVEKLACKHYAANIRKGKEIIQYYIDELIRDGVTQLPTWEEQCSRLELMKIKEKEGVAEEEGAAARARNDSISSVRTVTRKDSTTKEPPPPPTVLVNEVPKIDEDYIARCLGPLNPVEESRLMELRKWISEIHKDKMPNDAHLLRFLRAREFNMEKARDMLHRSLLWRKQHQIDRLLSAYKPHHVILDYFPGCWHHHDKEGRPLYVVRLGLMDFKGLLRSVGEDDLLRHVIATCEEGLNKCEKATRRRGKPISSWTGLVDLEGLSMRHLWRPGIKVLLRIIEVVEANYPETMGRLLIVRAPRVFPILWTLVSPFIDENTRNKFLIYGGNDYQGPGGLVDYIDAKYIPDFLGGDSMCEMPPGGTISKTLYQPEVDPSDLPPLEIDSIYHLSHIFKGVPHEVVVPVTESGTVITWDFDVMKNDCVFALLKTKRPVDTDVIAQHSHIHGQHGQHGPASPTLGNVMDRPLMALGVEAYNAESPLVCREGDSIQGSHVAGSMGTYVLQWKYRDPSKARASSAPTFDFSLTAHKCKIMYFYELLESAEFKGSMTSLQSCQSGFSSLSVNTSTSERSGISGASASCPSR